jgi:hypothetical protein
MQYQQPIKFKKLKNGFARKIKNIESAIETKYKIIVRLVNVGLEKVKRVESNMKLIAQPVKAK